MAWFKRVSVSLALALGFVALATSPSYAATDAGTVLDSADLFTAQQETDLTSEMVRDLDAYGIAYVVETVDSLDGKTIEEFATERANELAIGDNGTYIVIARDERKVRFELATDISAEISDSEITGIIDNEVSPSYRSGDYYDGTVAGMNALGESFVSATNVTDTEEDSVSPVKKNTLWITGGVVALVVLIGATVLIVRQVRESNRQRQEQALREKQNRESTIVANLAARLARDDDFFKAPDTKSRVEYLNRHYGDFMYATLDFEPKNVYADAPLYITVTERVLNSKINGVAQKYGITLNLRGYLMHSDDESLTETMERVDEIAQDEKVSQDAQRAREKKRREAAREAERVAREEREKLAQKNTQEAKTFWKSLSDEQKAGVRRAKTKKAKVAVLDSYASDNMNMTVFFPILVSVFASEVGRPTSESYGASSSYGGGSDDSVTHHSSPTPSFSSPSFDSSSSFGGDGGSGGF